MSEMIERVTAAIMESMRLQLGGSPKGFAGNPTAWTAVGDPGSLDAVLLASAAIAAMREPTEAMLEEGSLWLGEHYGDAEKVWQGMLDAALATPSKDET